MISSDSSLVYPFDLWHFWVFLKIYLCQNHHTEFVLTAALGCSLNRIIFWMSSFFPFRDTFRVVCLRLHFNGMLVMGTCKGLTNVNFLELLAFTAWISSMKSGPTTTVTLAPREISCVTENIMKTFLFSACTPKITQSNEIC